MEQQLELLGRDLTRHNVYFAALPDVAMRDRTRQTALDVRQRLGLTASPIGAGLLHVSLLSVGGFSGSCPPTIVDAALRAVGTVSIAPFRVEFDRIASFSGRQGKRALVLTGNGDNVAGFMRLQEALKHALMKAGLRLPRQSSEAPFDHAV